MIVGGRRFTQYNRADPAPVAPSAQELGRTIAKRQLDHQTLLRVLEYDPETGVFTRRIATSNVAPAGVLVGSLAKNGYWLVGVGGKQFYAHRVAWFYVHGSWPAHHIDHINGVKTDNRIANLRDVPRAVNLQNMRRAPSTSKSGLIGAVARPDGSFAAYIRIDGKNTYLGCFDTAEAAHLSYIEAKRRHHAGCTL